MSDANRRGSVLFQFADAPWYLRMCVGRRWLTAGGWGWGGEYVMPSHILEPFHNVFETFSNTKRGEVCGDEGAADFVPCPQKLWLPSASPVLEFTWRVSPNLTRLTTWPALLLMSWTVALRFNAVVHFRRRDSFVPGFRQTSPNHNKEERSKKRVAVRLFGVTLYKLQPGMVGITFQHMNSASILSSCISLTTSIFHRYSFSPELRTRSFSLTWRFKNMKRQQKLYKINNDLGVCNTSAASSGTYYLV